MDPTPERTLRHPRLRDGVPVRPYNPPRPLAPATTIRER